MVKKNKQKPTGVIVKDALDILNECQVRYHIQLYSVMLHTSIHTVVYTSKTWSNTILCQNIKREGDVLDFSGHCLPSEEFQELSFDLACIGPETSLWAGLTVKLK